MAQNGHFSQFAHPQACCSNNTLSSVKHKKDSGSQNSISMWWHFCKSDIVDLCMYCCSFKSEMSSVMMLNFLRNRYRRVWIVTENWKNKKAMHIDLDVMQMCLKYFEMQLRPFWILHSFLITPVIVISLKRKMFGDVLQPSASSLSAEQFWSFVHFCTFVKKKKN